MYNNYLSQHDIQTSGNDWAEPSRQSYPTHRMKLSEKHKIKLMVRQTKTNNQKYNHNNDFICLMGWLDATGSGRDLMICFTAYSARSMM